VTDQILVAALALVAGILAGVKLVQTKGQELLAWGLLAVAIAVLVLAL